MWDAIATVAAALVTALVTAGALLLQYHWSRKDRDLRGQLDKKTRELIQAWDEADKLYETNCWFRDENNRLRGTD